MREVERGLSGMLIASTPPAAMHRAASRILDGSQPRGGTTSTMRANPPETIFAPSADAPGRGAAGTRGRRRSAGGAPGRARARGRTVRSASRIARMCAGVVPQHPPITRTPACAKRRAYSAKYSGEARYMFRPSTFCGTPAFGCAESGRSTTLAIASIASSMIFGPTEQLTPTTSAPHSQSLRANAAGSVPYRPSPSACRVIWATTGRSLAERTPAMAWRISLMSAKVSRTKRSTPPAASARACSANAAAASSFAVGPHGSILMPSGPTAPATRTSPPAAARATRAPASLIAARRSSRPCSFSLNRFAPKVFVSMQSAPARMYSRWMCSTRVGFERLMPSKQRLMNMPRSYSSVPMPPSKRTMPPSSISRNERAIESTSAAAERQFNLAQSQSLA